MYKHFRYYAHYNYIIVFISITTYTKRNKSQIICVIWSSGTGFNGDQALGVQLLQLGNRKRQLINGEPLPLSPKSYLSWLGFTAEGRSRLPPLQLLLRLLGLGGTPMWSLSLSLRRNSLLRRLWRRGANAQPLLGKHLDTAVQHQGDVQK